MNVTDTVEFVEQAQKLEGGDITCRKKIYHSALDWYAWVRQGRTQSTESSITSCHGHSQLAVSCE